MPAIVLAIVLAACAGEPTTPQPVDGAGDVILPSSDPIAFVAHGGLFDHDGSELVADRDFVFAVQAYYLDVLDERVDAATRARVAEARAELERRGLLVGDDERAFASDQLIRFQARAAADAELARLRGKSATLYAAYQALTPGGEAQDFPAIRAVLVEAGVVELSPRAAGSYAAQCQQAGVPVPPDWGSIAWKYNGELTNEFIISGKKAEVYYFTSASPRGTCIALPRSTSGVAGLLGIICHGVDTSKACFWDADNVPVLGSKPLSTFRQGNTAEIANGGECTDCHGGENPFIVHPGSALDLAGKVPAAQWNTKNWYDPLIHASLSPNPGPTNAMNGVASAGSCKTCHDAMRLPDLSPGMSYCSSVLGQALAKTMPPGQVGSSAYNNHKNALLARCSTAAPKCHPDNAKVCAQAGGYCEQAFNNTGFRHDLCRWPDASQAGCASTAGIWTPASSGFAQEWPTAVPGGQAGACITQMRNIGGRRGNEATCTASNQAICRGLGGFCEDATSTSGGNHQLCRWPNHDTPSKCAATEGIWTAKGSGFHAGWPTAVRADEAGSCITQMKNIGGTRN